MLISVLYYCNDYRIVVITKQAGHLTYKNEARSLNLCCCEKEIIIKFFEFLSVTISYPGRNAHTLYYIVTSVACPILRNFTTLSYKDHDFR